MHDLTVTSHIGIADCTSLTSLLHQRTEAATEVRKEVEERHTVDALFLADLTTDDATNDAWTHSVQTPEQDAASAGSFGQLSRRIVVHAVRDTADRTVAKTAEKAVLPLCHRDCKHTQLYFHFQFQSGSHQSDGNSGNDCDP